MKVKSVWLLGMRNNKQIELKGTPKVWDDASLIDGHMAKLLIGRQRWDSSILLKLMHVYYVPVTTRFGAQRLKK